MSIPPIHQIRAAGTRWKGLAMVQVRRLGQQDWKTLRDVRMAALADAPHAFWATFQEESRFEQGQWRRFLKAAAWWTATRNDRVVGVVAVLRRGETLDEAELIAMWVAPDERRRGTATRMLQAACEWARAAGTQTLTLWVTEGNDPAKRLYESWGFQATGERAELPHTAATGEERMQLRLSDPIRTGS
jgi:GNAT superfamily N-acetyltransferase